MRKGLKWTILLFSCVVGLALWASQYARTVSPLESELWPLVAIGYPVLLLLYVGLIGFWVVFKKWIALIMTLLLLIFGHGELSDVIQLSPSLDSDEDGITLLTYNARLFGYYQFENNKVIRDSIFDSLEGYDADILCFQEFYHTDNPKGFQTKPLLLERLAIEDVHEKYTHEFVHKQFFGVVTLSRFPIVHRGYIPFPGDFNNFCIYSDIVIPAGDTLRVFNAHLASIHFRKEDYDIMDTELSETEQLRNKSNGILKKLRSANARRAVQIERIMEEVERSPYATLFVGDFNDPPFSYTYHRTRSILKDAFKAKGFGTGNTYNGPFPSFRIDHVLYSPQVEILNYTIDDMGLSDHFPVLVDLTLRHD